MSTKTQYPIFEQVVETVESTQARVIELNQRVAETVIDNLKDRLPTDRVRLPELPALGSVPAAADVVDNYFKFAGRLNDANHTFTRQMIEAWSGDAKPTKKVAPKAAAKKATAKAKAATKA